MIGKNLYSKRSIEMISGLNNCTIDLTERCNLACDYCFTWHQNNNMKTKDLTEEMGLKIIDKFIELGDKGAKRNISWWGGEPLLKYKLLQKLVLYTEEKARQQGFDIEFGGTTNGLLYTPERLEWLIEHKSAMLVSLDGVEEAHNMHRKTVDGKGSWKYVDKNLREALKIFPQQRVRASISVDTLPWFFETVQYIVEDLGIKDLAFSAVYEGNYTQKDWELLEEQLDLIVNYQIKRHLEGDPVVIKHLNDEARINKQLQGPRNPCGAGNHYCSWTIDGYCFPCHRFNKHNQTTDERKDRGIAIASIYDEGIINVPWRNCFITFFEHPNNKCVECELYRRSTCKGGCYAVNYDLTGSIFTPDERVCKWAKIQHEAGLKLAKLAKENNIKLLKTTWSGKKSKKKGGNTMKKNDNDRSCICYNMCYSEGTQQEISHIDKSTDSQCLCYMTNYSGEANAQHRTAQDIQEEKRILVRFLGLTKKIIDTKDVEKDEPTTKLESEVLDKTVWLVNKMLGQQDKESTVEFGVEPPNPNAKNQICECVEKEEPNKDQCD